MDKVKDSERGIKIKLKVVGTGCLFVEKMLTC